LTYTGTGAEQSGFGIQENELLAGHFRGQLAQGFQVIQNDDAPAVGGHDQVRFPLLDDHIADTRQWNIVAKRSPGITAVEAQVKAPFGAEEEEIRVDRVLADAEGISRHIFVGYFLPGRSAIGGSVEVGGHVVVAVAMSSSYRRLW